MKLLAQRDRMRFVGYNAFEISRIQILAQSRPSVFHRREKKTNRENGAKRVGGLVTRELQTENSDDTFAALEISLKRRQYFLRC